MKNLKWSLLLIILITSLFSACKNDNIGPGFEMNYFEDFEIFAGLNTLDTHIFEFNNIQTEKQFFFDNNQVQDYQVSTIVPKAFRLTALDGGNFDHLERVRVNILTESGTLEREIAFREPVPLGTTTELDLLPTLAEVTEYLKGERFRLKIKLNFRQIPSKSMQTRLTLRFYASIEE